MIVFKIMLALFLVPCLLFYARNVYFGIVAIRESFARHEWGELFEDAMMTTIMLAAVGLFCGSIVWVVQL